ncbi:hypothetical protein ACTMU2_14585 [Cupriavidus basilensis]
MVTLAREAGANLILLSDAPVSTLAAKADAVLRCAQPRRPGLRFLSVAAVSLVNYLATAGEEPLPQPFAGSTHGPRGRRARRARGTWETGH